MRLSDIKMNPKNPRIFKKEKLTKLMQSIESFPKMMFLRPIVIDENNIIQGGNFRYKALKALKYEDIPDGWVKKSKDLTPEEWKEFSVKDNLNFGDWDWDILSNEWDKALLENWGMDIENSPIVDEDDFEKRFNKINDSNCVYPLVPEFEEKWDMFVIVSNSEIDSNWLREKFGMQKMTSYKNGEIGKSNIINIEQLKNVL